MTSWTTANKGVHPCSTTGIGSLPYATVEEALTHVFSHYEIPFLPQLPNVSKREQMIAQPLEDFPGFREKKGAFSVELDRFEFEDFKRKTFSFAAFSALPRFLKQNRSEIIKLQMTGPSTIAEHLYCSDKRRLIDHPEIYEYLILFLIHKTQALIDRFEDKPQILFLFDEPVLTEKNSEMVFRGLGRMVDVLSKKSNTLFGLHSCNRWSGPVFSEFFKSPLKMLSMDMLLNVDSLLADVEVMKTWMAYLQKGWMVWGLGPDTDPSNILIARFKNEGLQNKKIISIIKRSLLSPACGTGLLSVAQERACAIQLKKSAQRLREIIDSETESGQS